MNATVYFRRLKFIVSLLTHNFCFGIESVPKKAGLFALLVALLTFNAKAQVTIGDITTPNKHAILELKTAGDGRGLLLPGVKLEGLTATTPSFTSDDVPQGLLVYNTGADASSLLTEGLYYWNGSHWEATGNNWFYMPATTFNTDSSKPASENSKDLYAVYAAQFASSATQVIGSTGAPAIHTLIPAIPARTDFYYYVISYDTTVFDNISINANGEMTYDLLKDGDESTYINIVFVRKR
ncbi:MAG: hypothetical protein LBP83_00865 [Dysgonamonadaceae bacterium]|jgi:hypothetical protein|nr:hypothetical protein [Dysgonamonadaceae bacterium]